MNLAPQPPQPPPPTHPLGVVVNGSTAAASAALDLLDDFEPQPRDRCNTWPLQRPSGDLGHNTSPLIHEDIPEEADDEECLGSDGNLSSTGSTSCYPSNTGGTLTAGGYYTSPGGIGGEHVPACAADFGGGQSSYQNTVSGLALSSQPSAASNKKNTSRRNAWGNLSYADLITQAIQSSPEQRLTLNEIYTWFFTNLPFFREKGDSNSSAGWKNSIRHNLSLHNRFLRLQNEGAGKSSWWTLNPDAKPGKSSRRRTGSMEQQQAVKLMEKKRGRSKKKLDPTRASTGTLQEMYPGGASCSSTSINSLGSPSIDSTSMGGASVEFKSEFMEGGVPPNAVLTYMPGAGRGGPMDFRGRSDSSVSDYLPGSKSNGSGAGHLSPTVEAGAGLFDDWDYNGPSNASGGGHLRGSTSGCSDLDGERDSLRYPDLIHTLSQSMTLGGAAGDPMSAAAANGPSSVRQRLLQSAGARMGPPPPPYRPLMNGFGVSNAADNGPDATDVVRSSPANPDETACGQTRGHSVSLATASATTTSVKQQPVISSNGFCGSGASGGPVDVKTEPPAYQELYGRQPASAVGASNPMLRDVLQHKILANHQKLQQQQHSRPLTSASPHMASSATSVFLMTTAPVTCDLTTFSSSGRLLTSSPSDGLLTSTTISDAAAGTSLPLSGSACCVRPSAAATALLYQQHRQPTGSPLAGCSLYGQAVAEYSADPSVNSSPYVSYVMPPTGLAHQYHHSHPYYPTPLQLPMELSEIHYDHTFKADIQCDIEQVIRHEMHVAGNLDFTDI